MDLHGSSVDLSTKDVSSRILGFGQVSKGPRSRDIRTIPERDLENGEEEVDGNRESG